MTAHLKVKTSDVARLPAHYQGIAHDLLRTAWKWKILIVLLLATGLEAAVVALVLIPPRYTSEAILQVNFNWDGGGNAARTQKVASAEAVAVVESAMRIVKSRALASAVVSRLGLDRDDDFSRASLLRRTISSARSWLGITAVEPTPHDLAVDRLMGALRVSVEPRSYLILVSISAGRPERAATLANAVALEYLRSRQLQQLGEIQRGLERDVADLAPVYGARHPRSVEANAKLADVQRQIATLRSADALDDSIVSNGDLLPAEPVRVPSGPNAVIIVITMLVLSLIACVGLIVLLERKSGLFLPRRERGDEAGARAGETERAGHEQARPPEIFTLR
jgi:uncharacterized protein involved in exopolysaccharide biosynthesis